ncbi:MAG TPA: pyridoxal 5'-phosphate synthase glutaminase subunit PdxT [Polyangiaceae bacterium]|nr:pyridoxal 5'-phosphate synthase glutaminase subunit PdxT [Polyangiaceae bacterium]
MAGVRTSHAEQPVLGVLALQGAFARHAERLAERGHTVRLLRAARDFDGLGGLVLPGGESTVQLDLLARLGLEGPLVELVRSGCPVLATCAGMILLARGVGHPAQRSFGLLDIDVARNAYGRQLDSFEAASDEAWPPAAGDREPSLLPLVFIRAPRIERVGAGVEVLARHRGEPVLVRAGNITAASFHPELTLDARVHDAVFGPARARRALAQ